jgi:2'-5' RNA ligase
LLYSCGVTDSTQDKTRRFFFALWPDPRARALIGGLAREVALESGGRPTLPDLIHLTLAFVGAQPAIRVDSLRRLAGLVRASSFALALDKIGGFQRTGIAWLGSTNPQSELLALQRDLTDALRMRAFPIEDRSYAPHLTLARRSTTLVERRLPQPIGWRVNAFALVASETAETGPSYRTIAEWPLVSV